MRPRLVLAITVLVSACAAAPAQAGRAIVTGHDADLHCAGSSSPIENQCHYFKVAVDFVRAGSSKPVLVLDRGGLKVGKALDLAYGIGMVPRTVVDPRAPEFKTTALSVANFSAIIVASDSTCGGCDLNDSSATPDSDAINARAAEFAAFYNDGGGIFALAGADHGDGSAPDDTYYKFLPITVGGVAVTQPFALTAEGKALGFTDGTGGTPDDINCCPTHNSFELPAAGGALKVAETDSMGKAETLFAEGSISGGTFTPTAVPKTPPPAFGPTGVITGLPSAKKCLSRRSFRIRIRERRGRKYETVLVFVNGKRVAVRRGARVTAPVDLRGLPKGRFTVKISVITTRGEIITGTRKYRTCAKKRRGGGGGPL
jgi:hypothetical protein